MPSPVRSVRSTKPPESRLHVGVRKVGRVCRHFASLSGRNRVRLESDGGSDPERKDSTMRVKRIAALAATVAALTLATAPGAAGAGGGGGGFGFHEPGCSLGFGGGSGVGGGGCGGGEAIPPGGGGGGGAGGGVGGGGGSPNATVVCDG